MAAEFAYCETIWASGISKWHIRQLTERGKKPSGGADSPGLCGREVAWDLEVPITAKNLDPKYVCTLCRMKYITLTEPMVWTKSS